MLDDELVIYLRESITSYTSQILEFDCMSWLECNLVCQWISELFARFFSALTQSLNGKEDPKV